MTNTEKSIKSWLARSTTKENQSKYCQTAGCGYQGKELYKIPFRKRISHGSRKADIRVIVEYILVCGECKKKSLDKE